MPFLDGSDILSRPSKAWRSSAVLLQMASFQEALLSNAMMLE